MNSAERVHLCCLVFFFLFCSFSSVNSNNSYNSLIVANNGYMDWIKHIGSRNHSVFQQAENKFQPCKIIKVHKKPKLGDFTTVQQAIDSIPIVNLCRVVISVGRGTYR